MRGGKLERVFALGLVDEVHRGKQTRGVSHQGKNYAA
jgi:hypothetical protein